MPRRLVFGSTSCTIHEADGPRTTLLGSSERLPAEAGWCETARGEHAARDLDPIPSHGVHQLGREHHVGEPFGINGDVKVAKPETEVSSTGRADIDVEFVLFILAGAVAHLHNLVGPDVFEEAADTHHEIFTVCRFGSPPQRKVFCRAQPPVDLERVAKFSPSVVEMG